MKKALVFLGLISVWAAGQTTVVLYSSGLAWVEETRRFTVSEEGVLELSGFPTGTMWETLLVEGVEMVRLRPLSPGPWSLARLLGQEVAVETKTGTFRGILREVVPEGLVLETGEGVVLVREYTWVQGPRYGAAPTALALLDYRSSESGQKELRFRYLARGLSWAMAYDAEFHGGALHILGKASIQNTTGVDFPEAKITLIAGEIRTPTEGIGVRALAAVPEAAPTEAFEYYRYDLPGTWSLPQGEVLLPLVKATASATQFYRFSGARVEVRVRFTSADQILPAGEMRVYAEGIFVGSSPIPHLPKGESAELLVGYAFDLRGSREQVKRERIGENLFRDTWRISLRSEKPEEVEVEVIEILSGYWRILSATLPYEVLDAQRVKFVVPVPPKGGTALEYTVEWRY